MRVVPYRPYLIAGLVVLAIGGYVLGGAGATDEPSQELTVSLSPQAIELVRGSAPSSVVEPLTERLRAVTPVLATVPVSEPKKPTIESRKVDPLSAVPLGPPVPKRETPRYVDVTLDPSGRPYDTTQRRGARLERRPLTVLHAPSRRVLFMGGEEASYPDLREGKPLTLAERPGRRYRIDAVWLDEKAYDSIVGVVIVERDSPVVHWRQLQRVAYGTDAGLGAITTYEWATRKKKLSNEVSRRYWKLLVKKGRLFFVADVDRHDGVDTLVFSNGFGDGGFPSVAGFDAQGRRAQIVLWTIVAPWRLAFPKGEPPRQVTAHERALAACLARERQIDGMRCRISRG
jgi:hypothetical protein